MSLDLRDPSVEFISRFYPRQAIPAGVHTELYSERDNPDGTIRTFHLNGTCAFECAILVTMLPSNNPFNVAFAVPDGNGTTTAPPTAAVGVSTTQQF